MAATQSTPDGAQSDTILADPTPLEVAAIQLHEAYCAYREAGFSEDQSLTIIARMAAGL